MAVTDAAPCEIGSQEWAPSSGPISRTRWPRTPPRAQAPVEPVIRVQRIAAGHEPVVARRQARGPLAREEIEGMLRRRRAGLVVVVQTLAPQPGPLDLRHTPNPPEEPSHARHCIVARADRPTPPVVSPTPVLSAAARCLLKTKQKRAVCAHRPVPAQQWRAPCTVVSARDTSVQGGSSGRPIRPGRFKGRSRVEPRAELCRYLDLP